MIQQEIEHDIEEDNEKELRPESNNVKNDNEKMEKCVRKMV